MTYVPTSSFSEACRFWYGEGITQYNPIIGPLNMLHENILGNLSEEQRETIQYMLYHCYKGMQCWRHLMNYTDLRYGNREVEWEIYDVCSYMRSSVRQLEELPFIRPITFIFHSNTLKVKSERYLQMAIQNLVYPQANCLEKNISSSITVSFADQHNVRITITTGQLVNVAPMTWLDINQLPEGSCLQIAALILQRQGRRITVMQHDMQTRFEFTLPITHEGVLE